MRRQVRQLIVAAALLVANVVAVGAVVAAEPATSAASRVERASYVVEISGGADVRPGVPAHFEVRMTARGGMHLNADYPSSFKVTPGSAEVSYPLGKVDKASGLTYAPCLDSKDSCSARAPVPFVIAKPGAHVVGGVFAFSVCDKEQCLIEKVPLTLAVTVR